MNKWTKRGTIGLVIVVVIAAGLSKLKATPVETTPAQKKNVTATVVEKGKIVSTKTVDIYSERQGNVKAVFKDTGDLVTPGTLLATLNDQDLVAQIAQLEGELKAITGLERVAQANPLSNHVKQQQLAIDQAKISLKQATANYTRTQQLYAEGAVNAAELELAMADLETKQKAVAQAEAALRSLKEQSQGNRLQYQGQRESAQARLTSLKSQLAKTNIVAEQQGIVFAKKIKSGDYITPGMLLFTLGNTNNTEIETYVNNKDMTNVRKGNQVTIAFKVPGADLKVSGKIRKIAPVAEEKVSALGIIEDKVKVTVKLLQKPAGIPLTPGMTVDVTVVTQEADQVLAIPKDAVFTENGHDYVWIIKQGTAQIVQIKKGIEGDELVELKQGLAENAVVLLNPHQADLKEGLKVTPAK